MNCRSRASSDCQSWNCKAGLFRRFWLDGRALWLQTVLRGFPCFRLFALSDCLWMLQTQLTKVPFPDCPVPWLSPVL